MITFYDIPSKLPETVWNLNTLKTRISLNYKGIPYKTEWVEFPDIEPTLKRVGGAPTSKKADGHDYYTLPAIHDSATGKVIADSTKIAEYLDAIYPDKPLLFPPGTHAAIETLEYAFMQAISGLMPILVSPVNNILNPRSKAYFRDAREQQYGKKLEQIAPLGTARAAIWKDVKDALERLAEFYDKNGEDKQFYLSNTFSFADAIVIGFLTCIKLVLGADSDEWKSLASWSNGRWGKLVESTEELVASHELN